MQRNEKMRIVADLHDIFANAGLVVITHQSGMTVGESTELRRRRRQEHATYRVVKTRLTTLRVAPPEQGNDAARGCAA